MSPFKKIFTLKNKEPEKIEKESEENIKQIKLSFFESGYGSSKQAEGNHRIFKNCRR